MLANGSIQLGQDWRTADRSSAGIAPEPGEENEAVVQIYSARAFSWRGLFAVHTWLATKRTGEQQYTVHHVIGWRSWYNKPVVVLEQDIPDRKWYGNSPEIIVDLRGAHAEAIIDSIFAAVKSYPYPHKYVLWPGPNSNTFTAYVGRQVPQLRLDLPPTAVGKDFLVNNKLFARAPSGSGYQFSLYGLFGMIIAKEEGLEVNILGFCFGINPLKLSVKLPGIGIISPSSFN